MRNPPITDSYELIKQTVHSHMKPFIEVTMMEHERTRSKIDEMQKSFKIYKDEKVHNYWQDLAIVALTAFMIIGLTAC